MSGYGRLQRGPMGAEILGEQFSQTYNGVWRDTRLTPKAMGVFGNLSTHRDGYGLSAKGISKQMKGQEGMVKTALNELEEVGYLFRLQTRNDDGTTGQTLYFITDIPDHVDIAEHAAQAYAQSGATKPAMVITKRKTRSAPVGENPPAVNPPAENDPPKKTNHKNTSTAEQGKGEEGAPERASSSPVDNPVDNGPDAGWGIDPTDRPAPEQGTLLARTVIDGIAAETGLDLKPWQHRRLVLEHLPAALTAVRTLGDDAVSGTELVEWLRADHDTTQSLYAVLATRCRPDYLTEALPVWVARTRTPGGLPAPSTPPAPRPRREQDAPDADPDPFTRAGAPPTCPVHPGIALTADLTGQCIRCHMCEDLPAPAAPGPSAEDLADIIGDALPDTESDLPDHCGARECHEAQRHIIRFSPAKGAHVDLGPCPRCHPDHAQERAA